MSLFTSLRAASNTLLVFDQALATIQNNVNNASTPGYAKQRLTLEPLHFSPELGVTGGVMPGDLVSSRDQYSEEMVRRQQHLWGFADETAGGLSRLEALFDVTGQSGIPGALNALFQSFSAWSVAPNDTVARNSVIETARDATQQFNQAATSLGSAVGSTDNGIRYAVDAVNSLAETIRGLNTQIRRDFRVPVDPNVDAKMQSTLEQLAEYVDFTALRQADGSVTVLLGTGQSTLVIGDRLYPLAFDTASGSAVVRDTQGHDITGQLSSGRLAAQLRLRNATIPSYLNDLNQLAAGLADTVNTALNSGVDANGQPGADLFQYNAGTGAAITLSVTGITADQLAAALAGAPGGNGNALALAALAGAPSIGNESLTGFYGRLAARAGRDLSDAGDDRQTQSQLLAQARSLRSSISDVSLDEEAMHLIEFQRSYQAAARFVTVLDELTQTVIGMLR